MRIADATSSAAGFDRVTPPLRMPARPTNPPTDEPKAEPAAGTTPVDSAEARRRRTRRERQEDDGVTEESSRSSDPTRVAHDFADETISMRLKQPAPPVETVLVLRVVAGRDMLSYLVLTPGTEALIGRDEAECRLHLSDASVSRRHARVNVDKDGGVVVQDLGSTNGTSIDNRPISRAILAEGQVLEIGSVGLRLEQLAPRDVEHLQRVVDDLARANRDPLMGIKPRVWLDTELPDLLVRADATRTPISGVLLDLDHFKRVNDRYGHTVGDDVLSTTGRLVMFAIRNGDTAVRYGGEELYFVLPGADLASATAVAERLRNDIEHHEWERTAPGLRVTGSAGVAQRYPGETIRDWIERADRALYRAKAGGRNRVVVASR